MTNWVIIYVGKVVAVIEKEGNIDESDYSGNWDTVTDDPSKTFKVGDDFTADLQFEYNKEVWREMGLYSDPIPEILPESVVLAREALQLAMKEANIKYLDINVEEE